MTPAQVRKARRLLGWSAERLGALSGMPARVIQRYEKTGQLISPRAKEPAIDRLGVIRAALEEAGVEFTDGDASGVKLRRGDP